MKRKFAPESVLRLAAAAAVAAMFSVSPAAAAQNAAILSPDQITKVLLDDGYTKVISMEMEDGVYEVKVKTAEGKRQRLNVDPATGAVLGAHKEGLFSR